MCCFSGHVEVKVSRTNILARRRGDRQLLVYEMRLAAPEPVAMILPLPVAPRSGEDALRFIDLRDHADLFAEIDRAFIRPEPRAPFAASVKHTAAPLRVEQVGAYEASYVPRIADFDRLDPRFRIDDELWARLPGYRDAGFAVFQLRAGEQRVHPMAFEFPARWPQWLYFPTVHIHDGALPERAAFDHSLYFQGFERIDVVGLRIGRPPSPTTGFRGQVDCAASEEPVGRHVRGPRAAELLDLDDHVFRLKVRGELRNDDTWLLPDPVDPMLARTGYGVSAWSPP